MALMLYGAEKEWEVVWASHMMRTLHPEVILKMEYPLRKGQITPNGGSLWIRKLGPALRQAPVRDPGTK